MLNKKTIFIALAVSLLAVGCSNTTSNPSTQSSSLNTTPSDAAAGVSAPTSQAKPQLSLPVDNALARVTKKPFGLKVSPQNSPVSPEKFAGYHTGTDFETLPEEANIDVTVKAVCAGKLLVKKYATGYGGVVVQACKLYGADVTIVYGHVKLASIVKAVGVSLAAGDEIGVLGKGYSSETDGERKHLHLGIHKGTNVNILGYVQSAGLLSGWLNALDYMK